MHDAFGEHQSWESFKVHLWMIFAASAIYVRSCWSLTCTIHWGGSPCRTAVPAISDWNDEMRAMVWMWPSSSWTSTGGTGMCREGRRAITTIGPMTKTFMPTQRVTLPYALWSSVQPIAPTAFAASTERASFQHRRISMQSLFAPPVLLCRTRCMEERSAHTLKRQPPCSTYCCRVAGSLKSGGPSPLTSCSTPFTCTEQLFCWVHAFNQLHLSTSTDESSDVLCPNIYAHFGKGGAFVPHE